jgi:hypothetical protein
MPIPCSGGVDQRDHCTVLGTIWVQFFLLSLESAILLGIYVVELVGLEPTTSSLRTMRSPN